MSGTATTRRWKFPTAARQAAGSCKWPLIFEHWGDHRLGHVKHMPQKGIVLFGGNWVKIHMKGINRVAHEDEYHGLRP